jgi:zinc D-Ala-D-Ala carboxypeptidase
MATFLTPHFSLEELCVTQQRRLDNRPPPDVVERLRRTAEQMEVVREILGGLPITVTSGYRSAAVNRAVGGVPRSAHLTGGAVDFNCHGFGDPLAVCRALVGSNLEFDQIIEEGRWVHLAFGAARRQVLTKWGQGYRAGLPPAGAPRAAATRART